MGEGLQFTLPTTTATHPMRRWLNRGQGKGCDLAVAVQQKSHRGNPTKTTTGYRPKKVHPK